MMIMASGKRVGKGKRRMWFRAGSHHLWVYAGCAQDFYANGCARFARPYRAKTCRTAQRCAQAARLVAGNVGCRGKGKPLLHPASRTRSLHADANHTAATRQSCGDGPSRSLTHSDDRRRGNEIKGSALTPVLFEKCAESAAASCSRRGGVGGSAFGKTPLVTRASFRVARILSPGRPRRLRGGRGSGNSRRSVARPRA